MKNLIKLLLSLSMLFTCVIGMNGIKVQANDVETRAVQIQMSADGEETNQTHTYNGKTITYTVKLMGTYVVDINEKILSTNIGATVSQTPTGSDLKVYVVGCSTTFANKTATTVVTVGFQYKTSVTGHQVTYTFYNSVK